MRAGKPDNRELGQKQESLGKKHMAGLFMPFLSVNISRPTFL